MPTPKANISRQTASPAFGLPGASLPLSASVLSVSCWRFLRPRAIRLFLALCLCVFLHALRRLSLLDHRASRDRRGVVGGRPAPAGKHRRSSCSWSWRCSSFRSCLLRHHLCEWLDDPAGHDPLLDAKRGISELAFLPHPRDHLSSPSSCCSACLFRGILGRAGQGRQSRASPC